MWKYTSVNSVSSGKLLIFTSLITPVCSDCSQTSHIYNEQSHRGNVRSVLASTSEGAPLSCFSKALVYDRNINDHVEIWEEIGWDVGGLHGNHTKRRTLTMATAVGREWRGNGVSRSVGLWLLWNDAWMSAPQHGRRLEHKHLSCHKHAYRLSKTQLR